MVGEAEDRSQRLTDNPHDGLQAFHKKVPALTGGGPWDSVGIQAVVGGKIVQEISLMGSSHPQLLQLGEMASVYFLLDALCRFANTQWRHLDAVQIFAQRVSDLYHEYFGERTDWTLIDTFQNSELNFEHVFMSPDETQYVRWVEGQYLDHISESELQHELQTHVIEAGLIDGTVRVQLHRAGPALPGPVTLRRDG